MTILRAFFYISFGLSIHTLHGQGLSQTSQVADSITVFSISDLYDLVMVNHPVVKQAALLNETARQQIRLARGGFDPTLRANWDVKNFKDTDYYNIMNTSLVVPIWFPIDPEMSVDRNQGVFLNPERNIPSSSDFWQITTGVSLPVGKGLFIDERRAAVKQAIIFTELTEAEQIEMINGVLLKAGKDYWNWSFAYHNLKLLERSIEIAEEIFQRVKLNVTLGEAAPIDTVQALISLQNRQIEMQQAQLDFIKSQLTLSNHLWGENGQPLELSIGMAPMSAAIVTVLPDRQELELLLDMARNNHPEILKLHAKREQLQVQNQLNRESLKPQLDLKYGMINAPLGPGGEGSDYRLDQNYKFGLKFSMPLFLRKERAKILQTDLKVQETIYQLSLRHRQVLNEISATHAHLVNSAQIIQQRSVVLENYDRILQAELLNLRNGESDLFRINLQQDRLIRSQSNLLKLKAEYEKSKIQLLWAAGVPHLQPL